MMTAKVEMSNAVRTSTKADNGKLTKVLEFGNGSKIAIPINKDGTVKWFDDLRLLKANRK